MYYDQLDTSWILGSKDMGTLTEHMTWSLGVVPVETCRLVKGIAQAEEQITPSFQARHGVLWRNLKRV